MVTLVIYDIKGNMEKSVHISTMVEYRKVLTGSCAGSEWVVTEPGQLSGHNILHLGKGIIPPYVQSIAKRCNIVINKPPEGVTLH